MYKIYLDQNFVSDITKIDDPVKSLKIKPEIKVLYKLIVEAVVANKIIIPFSPIHCLESLNKNDFQLRQLIFEKFNNISKIRFRESKNIREQVFIYYALNYFGKKFGVSLDDIYINRNDDDFQKFWFSQQNIQERMLNDIVDKIIDSPQMLQDIRVGRVNSYNQYECEITSQKKDYQELANREKFLFERYDLTLENIYQFINSEKFQKIPNVDIFCKLWGTDLANTARKGQKGDENDIEILSVYAPYCDIVATDNHKRALMQSLKIDIDYDIEIFSMNNIKELLDKIKKI